MQLDLASSCLPPSHPSTCWDIALYCGTAATAHSRWGSPAATGFEIKNWTNPHFGALDGQTQSEFWKRAKWLQVCQLLLHPCLLLNIILYSETEEQFVLPDEGATLLFVSNSYFHGKTVFSCNSTSISCRTSVFVLPSYRNKQTKKNQQNFIVFCLVPEKL